MNHKYLTRISDTALDTALRSSHAVLIEGPKGCGKTSSAKMKSASFLFMQDPVYSKQYLRAADIKPSLLLKGAVPRLLDEWQMAPVLWDAVLLIKNRRRCQFILTGSAVPTDNVIDNTGRFSKIFMRPMSLYESKDSNGEVSLKSLFDGDSEISGTSALAIEELAFVLARGGWPEILGENESNALRYIHEYLETVINNDISKVDGVKKNPAKVRALMYSLARNISITANISKLKKSTVHNGNTMTEKTISSYLNALRKIFIIEDLPAWRPNLKTNTAIRIFPKRHYTDPSIAAAMLKLKPEKLLQHFIIFGRLFESMCIRDLRVYAQAIDGNVFHYRDKNRLEINAIIQLKDGRWGAADVKMGNKEIEKAAENLKKLKEKINTEKMKGPSFLMVLTCTESAYRRKDGVYIVPVGCLKN